MDPGKLPQSKAKRQRKSSADNKDVDRVSRRRNQNRISQRCVREKQQAHKKQLEMFVDMIKSRTGISNDGDGHNELLDAHMALIEENKRLKDALLEMRKKMLSLSSVAEVAADHSIFKEILRSQKDDRGTIERSVVPSSSSGDDHASPDCPRSNQESLVSSEAVPAVSGPEAANNQASTDLFTSYFDAPTESFDINIWCPDIPVSDAPSDTGTTGEPIFDIGCNFSMFDAYPDLLTPLGSRQSLFSFLETCQNSPISTWQHPNSVRPVPCHFITKVEKACMKYVAQALCLSTSPSVMNGPSPAPQVETRSAQCISNVAAVAIYILTTLSGLDTYIYDIGSDVPFERIVRWRMNPTLQNRLAIPEPFCPTPLQYSSPDHPMAIDFIPTRTIRDQLILKSQESDIDRVIRDVTRHTVVEVPQRQVALGTLDTYMKSIPKEGFSDAENRAKLTPSWSPSQYTEAQVEEILMHELSWRMKNRATACLMSDGDEVLIPKYRKNNLASSYGIDRVSQWKLSKEFFDNNPHLDCNYDMSSYPVVAWSSIAAC